MGLLIQIFHPTEPRVIGILDWELCTLGSPLADLGNLLLAFSFSPVRDKALIKELKESKADATLMIGLKGLKSEETGLPEREELERWWVEGMNMGDSWHRERNGEKGRDVWSWPITGMG